MATGSYMTPTYSRSQRQKTPFLSYPSHSTTQGTFQDFDDYVIDCVPICAIEAQEFADLSEPMNSDYVAKIGNEILIKNLKVSTVQH
ncbi:hypothetical protein TNCV_3585501 [Trichonephila clavipes]|nr:hypothetical protein TNCV_3585501 [Trichonephila clavipes]